MATGSVDALTDWTNKHIEARYQKISPVMLVDEFPKNIAGKILKNERQELYRLNL